MSVALDRPFNQPSGGKGVTKYARTRRLRADCTRYILKRSCLRTAAAAAALVFRRSIARPSLSSLLAKRNIAEYADEEETLRAALEANPNDAVAHNNLGYLMETVYKVTTTSLGMVLVGLVARGEGGGGRSSRV